MITREEAGLADIESLYLTKGVQIGKTEGKAEGKAEIAAFMLQDGVPIETVSNYTGIPIAELQILNVSAE